MKFCGFVTCSECGCRVPVAPTVCVICGSSLIADGEIKKGEHLPSILLFPPMSFQLQPQL